MNNITIEEATKLVESLKQDMREIESDISQIIGILNPQTDPMEEVKARINRLKKAGKI
ncbi:hypothetical protein D3C76_1860080 [compost metagenome]